MSSHLFRHFVAAKWAMFLGIIFFLGINNSAAEEPSATIQFNSSLPLRVWISKSENARWPTQVLGLTPADSPLEVPDGVRWWVECMDRKDIEALSREVKAKSIPGLLLPYTATDQDLAYLSDLEELEILSLNGSNREGDRWHESWYGGWRGGGHGGGYRGWKWSYGFTDFESTEDDSDEHGWGLWGGFDGWHGFGGNLSWGRHSRNGYYWGFQPKSPVTDAGVKHLKALTSLRALDLAGTQVNDEGVASLQELTRLETLSLAGTQVTDQGVEALQEMVALRELDLSNTKVSEECAIALKKMKNLRTLAVHTPGNALAGMVQFGDFPQLEHLYHSHHDMGVGANGELISFLKRLQSLQELSTSQYALTDDALLQLAEMRGLRRLYLFDAHGITHQGIAHLKKFENLEALYFHSYSNIIRDNNLAALKELKKLRTLSMPHSLVTSAGMKHVKQIKSLEKLNLSGTKISNAGLKELIDLPKLQELYLYEMNSISDPGMAHVKNMRQLRVLVLGSENVSDAGLAQIKDMPYLETLVLDTSKVTPDGLAHLKRLKNLKNLYLLGGYNGETNTLQGIAITDQGMAEIKDLKQLQRLTIEHAKISNQGLAYLKELKQLKYLDLSGEKEDSEVTNWGMKYFKEMQSLEWLSFSGFHVTDSGVAPLNELKNLQGLSLRIAHLSDVGAKQLAELKRLQYLSVGNSEITDAGWAKLRELKYLQINTIPKASDQPSK